MLGVLDSLHHKYGKTFCEEVPMRLTVTANNLNWICDMERILQTMEVMLRALRALVWRVQML